MPENRIAGHRRIYTITEVEQLSGLAAHTLRWYEELGLIHGVSRGPGRRRLYSSQHLCWLELIRLLRTAGLSVEDMARFAALTRQGGETSSARYGIVRQYRDHFREQVEQRDEALRSLENFTLNLGASAGDAAGCQWEQAHIPICVGHPKDSPVTEVPQSGNGVH